MARSGLTVPVIPFASPTTDAPRRTRHRPIRLGYVPLIDAAPLLVAEQEGLFARHDLQVRLSREPGWASIREKLVYGELDAAQSLGALALALNLGIDCPPTRTIVPLILNANGNAITLSGEVPPAAIENAGSLATFLGSRPHRRSLTLATVHPCSSHHALLCQWLHQRGLHADDQVQIIFLPPPIVSRALAAGTIDGFCVGEPWSSHSILNGHGWCAATSVDLSNGHPEKVLAVSGEFEEQRPDDVVALTAALREACALCDDPDYRPRLIRFLQRSAQLGTTAESIANSLGTTFRGTPGDPGRAISGFHLFSGDAVNRPTLPQANWIVDGMRRTGLVTAAKIPGLSRIFRSDLYDAARESAAPVR